MNFQLENGNLYCWQWDIRQKIEVEGLEELNLAYPVFLIGNSKDKIGLYKVVPIQTEKWYISIPDEVLQKEGWGDVYLYDESTGTTKLTWRFTIKKKEKPQDYVYEPSEFVTLMELNLKVEEITQQLIPQLKEELKQYTSEEIEKAELDDIQLDKTLTKEGSAADSKAVGQKLEEVKSAIQQFSEKDPTVPDWAKEKTKPSYSKSEVGLGNVDNVKQYSASNPPPYPVVSVNGKTGKVQLGAADVGARPSNWMPTAQEVGALPDTYVPPNQTAAQVGADPAGTAAAAVSAHNTSTESHGDLRLELKAINDRLTAFFDSDNQTLDELSEIVAYITSNKALIDSITTSKVSVADIINNLTTNVANKPLSAAQGVVLKNLIDAVSASLSGYQPKGDYALASAIPTKVSQLQNDKGYLTEHQDISGKLDADKLPEAVNTALAQAKESGEFDGDPGAPGKDGTSVTVKSVSESTADGGSNVVTFSNGKQLTVKNGKQGSAGKNGADGKTPVKGVDFWTDADQEAIVQQVITALPVYNGEVV